MEENRCFSWAKWTPLADPRVGWWGLVSLTDGATLIGLRPDVYDALVPAHGQLAPRHSRRSD